MRVARYEVQRGDTLAGIAKENSTTPELLRHLNGLEPGRCGQHTGGALSRHRPARRRCEPRPWWIVERMQGRRSAHPVCTSCGAAILCSLAHRLGTDVNTLARLNNMGVSDPLRAGQRLVVSDRSHAAGSAGRGAAEQCVDDGSTGHVHGPPGRYPLWHRTPSASHSARPARLERHDGGQCNPPGQKLVAFVSSHG